MAFGMIVQLPVSVPFGTDEEFDLRVQLQRELSVALAENGVGESASGEINTSHMNLRLDNIIDPASALVATKAVLARSGLLGRAVVVLETPCDIDPDDRDCRVLWPPDHADAVSAG